MEPQVYLWESCNTCSSSSEGSQLWLESYFEQVKTLCNLKPSHWAGESWPRDLQGLILTSLQAPPKPEGWSNLHLWVNQKFYFSCCTACGATLWPVLCEGSTASRESDSSFAGALPPEEKVAILPDSHALSFLN